MNSKVATSRKVFHAISVELDIVSSGSPSQVAVSVGRLKQINEELSETVESLIIENEKLKIEYEKLKKNEHEQKD